LSERISRRAVLSRLGQAGLVAGASTGLAAWGIFSRGRFGARAGPQPLPDRRVAPDPLLPSIAAARGPDPATLVRAALERVGGMGRFVHPGERVLVKPNMAWDRTAEQGANTHPQVVAELVRQCRAAGASLVIVADNPVHDADRVAERSGIRRAALDAGAEVRLPAASGFTRARLAGAALDEWDVLSVAFEVDRLINVPVVKTHSLSLLTAGFKNLMGLIDSRPRLHQDIHPALVDLAAAFRPTLTVVDATRVMVRGGPTGGRLDDVVARDCVAVGTDPVACDAWAAGQLGLDPRDVVHIVQAEGRGLGRLRSGIEGVEERRAG
jgi:uncharacterized protein (DUF362 family)